MQTQTSPGSWSMASPESIGGAPSASPLLALKKLDKRFGATHALKAVDLEFEQGEIHAIVGENGAGKSTLIKVLTGVHPRTSGDVFWRGQTVALVSPHEAIELGINAVHQEVVLCRHLTVAANIFLGDEHTGKGLLKHGAMVREAQQLLDELGFDLPAGALLSSLTIGQQQLVATARAERRGAKFLIFDEPTAYLTRQEAAALFTLIRRLKANGVTIVYISHRLEEVFELADRVSVLRDGALVATLRINETNENALIALMINRSIEQIYHKDSVPLGATILETKGLSGKGFSDVSITVREGEIVGLYGLIGAGRSEFVQSLFGRFPATSGEILWKGQTVRIRSERDAMNLGIALAPESRRDQGLCLNLGVGFNINLPIFHRLTMGPIINGAKEAQSADKQIKDVQIKTASRAANASSLSGGNQQKIVIGRWLNLKSRLYIFEDPTAGVDVGAKAEIYRLFEVALQGGAAIVIVSTDFEEVAKVCHRALVFDRGRVVAEMNAGDLSVENLLAAASANIVAKAREETVHGLH